MSYKKKKTRFFKDNQKRTRIIPGCGDQRASLYVDSSHSAASTLHEQRLGQRIRAEHIPLQKVNATKDGVAVVVPEREVDLKLITAKTDDVVIPLNDHETQAQLDERAQVFVEAYHRGEVIPPVLLHRLPNGKLEVVDGRSRARAYQLLGVKEYAANENGILDAFNNSRFGTSHSANSIASKASKINAAGQKALNVGAFHVGRQLGKSQTIVKANTAVHHKIGAIKSKVNNKIDPHTIKTNIEERTKAAKERTRIANERIAKAENAEQDAKLFNDSRTASMNARAASKERLDNLAKARKAKLDKAANSVHISANPEFTKAKTYAVKAKSYADSSNSRRDSARQSHRRR